MFALFCLSIFFCVLWATLPEIKLMMMMMNTKISVFGYLKYIPTIANTTNKRNRMKDGLFDMLLLLTVNANINI